MRRNRPDPVFLNIHPSAVRIDPFPHGQLQSHAVHRRIPPVEILLHRHGRIAVDGKAAVAGSLLALLARESDLTLRAVNRYEIYREAASHTPGSRQECFQLPGSKPGHHIILIVRYGTAAFVTHPAADEEYTSPGLPQTICKFCFLQDDPCLSSVSLPALIAAALPAQRLAASVYTYVLPQADAFFLPRRHPA